jgi:hypothetical protein
MNNWYDSFLEALQKKYPQKSQLTKALMDLLAIERESVYRRLRKDIVFPSHEIAKIAAAWNISLDEIVTTNTSIALFKLQLWDYLKPTEEMLNLMHFWTKNSLYARNIANMQCAEVCNRLPRMLTSGFPYLNRLKQLQQVYQYANEETLPFSQLFYPEEVVQLSAEYYQDSKKFESVTLVFDHDITKDLVADIQYFQSIYLITEEEKELIKKDIYALLDYMSEAAAKGCWLETGNKMSLYVSHIDIDTNYSYHYSDDVKICSIHAFGKNEIYTENVAMVESCREFVQAQKNAAVLISKADEKSRIEFFREQRELIDTL